MLPLHRAVCASQATIVGGVSTSESISFFGGSASSRLQDEMIKIYCICGNILESHASPLSTHRSYLR